ncbi:MAG: hypothetical protein EA420_09820 [Candidatus Competibacteraceae bacterium]|nr:MAG: hypothetical protein EA420_09820 [Candidatus Competibacteraceae bacterium]
METLEYLVKWFGFLAIAITVLYVFVKIAMDWTILILARPALQGKGGPTRWTPHLAAVAYAGLAFAIAESTYPQLAPTPASCPETAGLWDGSLCAPPDDQAQLRQMWEEAGLGAFPESGDQAALGEMKPERENAWMVGTAAGKMTDLTFLRP